VITSYEDLNVWQSADNLAHRVFDLSEGFPKTYVYDLTSQLRRAALSVPTNIAEGCAAFHSREFLQFLNIARRSLSETQYLLGFARRRNLVTQDEMLEFRSVCEDISKMLNGLAKSIRKRTEPTHNT
jgi:four helix bundle protein